MATSSSERAAFALALVAFGTVAACASTTSNARVAPRVPLSQYFDEAGVRGTFLLYDLRRGELEVHDPARAATPFLPASTFKILNALIALETGVIADEHVLFRWDGVDRGSDGWNRDHDLASAIRVSAVWYFQELARRIGAERMQHYVDLARYGNRDTSGGIDVFWLAGGLRITPREQLDFLVRLYRNELPFSRRSMDIVKRILVVEDGPGFELHAKTGWAQRCEPQIGWYVGYLERAEGVNFFVINLDIVEPNDAAARREITRRILADRGLLPEVPVAESPVASNRRVGTLQFGGAR